MKKFLTLKTSILFFTVSGFAQVSVRFTCPGSQVIAYKLGTSCTASSYKLYTIDAGGHQAVSPFHTLASTSREINGLGINSVDEYLYGIEYDRDASCVFSNFHLFRYDAAGGKEDLGVIPAMAGGFVQTSMGCVSLQGDFIYSVIDGSGNRYIALIANIAALPPSSGTLTAVYKKLVNICSVASYADWAIDPTSGKLYSYGIYNNAGVSTGTVIEINPVSGDITCVGTPNSTEFLDPVRDNFGGVYFSGGGVLYGTNVNTRKLYRINTSDGSITLLSTMSGAGQMRADMGSCDNGMLVLAVKFKNVLLTKAQNKVKLTWEVADADDINSFEVETKNENGIFNTIGEVQVISKNQGTYSIETEVPLHSAYFRVAAVSFKGSINYSSIVKLDAQEEDRLRLLQNPVVSRIVKLHISRSLTNGAFAVLNTDGKLVKKGILNSNDISINLSSLPAGLYFLQVDGMKETMKLILQ